MTAAGGSTAEHSTIHPSGLTVLTGRSSTPSALPGSLDAPLGAADELLNWFPDDFAAAWVDRGSFTVVVGAVTPAGSTIIEEVAAGDYAAVTARGYHGDGIEKPLRDLSPLSTALADGLVSVRSVPYSSMALRRVMDDLVAIELDSNTIWMTYLDHEHNRVVAVLPELADDLAAEIVRRYGTTLVAVELAARSESDVTAVSAGTSESGHGPG